jgi:hypothetical protein
MGIFGHETNPLLTSPMKQASFYQMLKNTNNFLEVGMYAISGYTVNSLPAIDAHEHQFFDKLLWGLVTSTIFVRC